MSVPSVVFARAAYQEVDPLKSYEQGIFSLQDYFLGNMPVDEIFRDEILGTSFSIG